MLTARRFAMLAFGAACTVAASSLVAVHTAAAAATDPPTSVTIFLKAPHPYRLQQLSLSHGLSRAQRLAALQQLVPDAATHGLVAAALRAEGLHVTGQTAWSMTFTGASSTVASLFGTRPAAGLHPSAALRRAATGPLPLLPAALSPVVYAAYPTTGGPAAFHHSTTTTLAGPDIRNADTPASVAPSTGLNDAGRTIATLQLADFYGSDISSQTARHNNSITAADLTSYATEHSLTDPVASGQYQPVFVDGGPSQADDGPTVGGDLEVNLDQQSILSTAPSANQHAYFAPNTDAGFQDVFANVFDDVTGNGLAQLPDPHIVAMSVSWGQCESGWNPSSIASLQPILQSLVAAGVTIFASSGDDGIYDCRSPAGTGLDNSQADVDYPASSPSVVSTGGSRLAAPLSLPNTGTNWTETGWTCTDPVTCQNTTTGTGGTGGGASGSAAGAVGGSGFAGFAAPAYQKVAIDDPPFAGNAKRLVPDITADGDPVSGFLVFTSDPNFVLSPTDVQVGGTSLAAPISAAQLANTLSDAGRSFGVGDIHGALYSAYRQSESLLNTDPARPLRDVTIGSNGATINKGSDPSVGAQTGFDTVSGVGGVLWKALLPWLVDTRKPTVTASLTEGNLHTSAYKSLTAHWSVSIGTDSALLAPTTVRITPVGSSTPVFSSSAASGTKTITVKPGRTYVLTVKGADIAGRSRTKKATVAVPIDDALFSTSSGWTRTTGSADLAGSHIVAGKAKSSATVTDTGKVFAARFVTGPGEGKVRVSMGSTVLATFSLYSSTAGHATKTIFTGTGRAKHTFTFTVLGTKVAASSGTKVALDGLDVG